MLQQIRIFKFTISDPAWRTARDHRQHALMLDALNELMPFFHDRKIRGIVGIIDTVKPDPPQRRGHLAGNPCADRQAELLA